MKGHIMLPTPPVEIDPEDEAWLLEPAAPEDEAVDA